jgi:hypothetical protein
MTYKNSSSDGIKAFMRKFTATKAESRAGDIKVAPATEDFLKASSFLFRK